MTVRLEWRSAPYWLAAVWIAATAAYFYARFTWVVYQTHRHEIDALIERLFR